MVFNIEVNNRVIQARKGETILTALKRNGIKVPTLCNMKDFSPTGACRMCVVEVAGRDHLIPSCSFTVEEWMKISTHSPRVLRARKTIVELLLSNHPDDCLYCERNGLCELQKMAEDLNVRQRRIPGKKSKYKIDKSSTSIIRDQSKCILCGRCVRVCEEQQAVATLDFANRGSSLIISTALHKPLNFSNCINCGQCVVSCPTGALTEKFQFSDLDQILYNHDKTVVAQYSPTIAVSIAQEFGLKSGKDINGIINAALRKIGFDFVFETAFGADISILEQSAEFIQRLEKKEKLPLISSCCPSWIQYAEQNYPNFLSSVSVVRSPQQIVGSLIRNYISKINKIDPSKIYSVSIMPCTAKKSESQRVEMGRKGSQDIDTVLTTREFIRLIKLHGIDMDHLEPEPSNEPMSVTSSSGKLCSVSGGYLEGLARTISYKFNGKDLSAFKLNKLRTQRNIRELTIKLGKRDIKIAAVSGMAHAARLLEDVKSGKRKYQLIEIMACPGGCINGGGQPIDHDENAIRNRMKAVYDLDNKDTLKFAHRNPSVMKIYEEFLNHPSSKEAKEFLHTSYSSKPVF
jgi:iron-only hydrogenase group A